MFFPNILGNSKQLSTPSMCFQCFYYPPLQLFFLYHKHPKFDQATDTASALHQCTIWFMSMMGIMMASTINKTMPPMNRISSGSIRVVKVASLRSTSCSCC